MAPCNRSRCHGHGSKGGMQEHKGWNAWGSQRDTCCVHADRGARVTRDAFAMLARPEENSARGSKGSHSGEMGDNALHALHAVAQAARRARGFQPNFQPYQPTKRCCLSSRSCGCICGHLAARGATPRWSLRTPGGYVNQPEGSAEFFPSSVCEWPTLFLRI